MDHSPIETELEELESRIERLRSLYDQYFLGIEKLEPQIARKDVDRRVHALRKAQIRNTGLRFKMNMLIQRYNTLQQHWGRILREIENGTYKRDLARAAARFGNVEGVPSRVRRAGRRVAADAEKPEAGAGSATAAQGSENLQAPLSAGPTVAEPSLPPAVVEPGGTAVSNPRTSVDDLDFEDGLATDPSITASALALGRLQPTPGSLPAVRFTEGPLPAPAPSLPGLGFAPPSFRGSAPPPLPSRSTLVAGPPPLPSRASGTNPPATGSSLPAGIPPVSGPGLDIPAPPASLTVPARSTTGGSSLPIAPPSLPAVRPDSAPPARPAHADASGEASLSEPRLQQLFERYVESRRSTNEPVAGLTYERLADKLRSEAAKLKTTYKAQRVDYEVVVKDGKTILKPVLR